MTWTSLALWSFFSLPATAPILPVTAEQLVEELGVSILRCHKHHMN